MNTSDIKQLFDYTEWANDRVLEAADVLADEGLRKDVGISHKSIFGTLVHMAGAEWIWMERWNGRSPTKAEAWTRWSTESYVDLAMLREHWTELMEQRARYVSELDER